MIKIYAISIPRFSTRHDHIQSELTRKSSLPWEIVGVDALELRNESKTWKHAPTLRDSEVGCALSHASACRKIISDNVDFALIVEDDVILPDDIDTILEHASKLISCGEVISLYNRTIRPEKFSARHSEKLLDSELIYPMETRFMRTAAAYFLDRSAARGISEFNIPVRVVADNWAAYYQSNAINGIRLLHPIPVSLKPFESTLSLDRGNMAQRIARRAFNHWSLRKFRAWRRRRLEEKREKHLVLVDLSSDQIRSNPSKVSGIRRLAASDASRTPFDV